MEKLNVETIYKVVTKLVGRVDPQGESNFDEKAYENLDVLIDLTLKLIKDIDEVAYDNKDRQEASMKKAGMLANKFCEENLAE